MTFFMSNDKDEMVKLLSCLFSNVSFRQEESEDKYRRKLSREN